MGAGGALYGRWPARFRPPAILSFDGYARFFGPSGPIEVMMFDSLSDRLGGVFDKLRGRGALTEDDVRAAMREVRIALLEADVALPVVRQFVDDVTEQAVGQDVLRAVTPGQQVVKVVSDALTAVLGSETSELLIDVAPPAVIMMVGLQGSGKTTSTAKIAKRLKDKGRKKVL